MAARGKGKNYQGSKWIRREKRLAIYLRDGLSCLWCGRGIEGKEEIILSLDHIIPYGEGGSNEASNLITSCKLCNSSRGKRSAEEFAQACALFLNHGIKTEDILNNITTHLSTPLDMKKAKELVESRNSQ